LFWLEPISGKTFKTDQVTVIGFSIERHAITNNEFAAFVQATSDPRDPGVAKLVIKGGSFLCSQNYCSRYRPEAREAQSPDSGTSHIGFRLAAPIAAPAAATSILTALPIRGYSPLQHPVEHVSVELVSQHSRLVTSQRVIPLEALKAKIINGAKQYGEQSSKGSLCQVATGSIAQVDYVGITEKAATTAGRQRWFIASL
jgi:hypothetical protein